MIIIYQFTRVTLGLHGYERALAAMAISDIHLGKLYLI